MEIWLNPACSKCRSAVEILDEEGAHYTVRKYLEEPPTADELRAVLSGWDWSPGTSHGPRRRRRRSWELGRGSGPTPA